MAVQNLLQPVLVSVFAVLFSDYFCSIFTGLKGHETMVSVAILVIYGIMAYMGTYLFASINSLIVVVMMVAVYIVLGIPNIDASQLSIGAAFGSGIKIRFDWSGGIRICFMPLGRNCSIADCGVFPKALAKKNKNGVSTGILIYVMLFAIICVLTGSSFGVLMTVFSAVNALSDIPTCIVPFFLKKKYPHACNHAGIKFKYGMIIVLSVFAAVVAAFLAFSAFKALGASVYLIILAYMAAAVLYFIARIKYLKGKERNLIEELKTPYDEWEAREAECEAMDEAK